MENENVETRYALKGKVDNVKNLTQLIKCINFKEVAVFFASKNGIKIVVEDSKCVQASAFIGTDIFTEFTINEELVSFRLDINVLLECLSMFDQGSNQASLNLYYRDHGFPLRLVLVEEDVVTDCSIKTLEALEILHFDPPGERVYNKMIADGGGLKEFLSDLDSGSEYLDIQMSNSQPNFIVRTESTAGRCEASVSQDAEWIEEFVSHGQSLSRFKLTQFKPAIKTIQAAKKVSFQLSSEGLLCMQFVIMTESKQLCYIEYYCTPVIIDDEDDDETVLSQEF